MEIESRLRKFVSEILNPFNDRVSNLNRDFKYLKGLQESSSGQMASMLNKLDEALSLRDSIKSCNNNMHQIESRLGSKVLEVKGKLDET